MRKNPELAIGLIFLPVGLAAIFIGFLPGLVETNSTPADRFFEWIYILSFGGTGLVFLFAGGFMLLRQLRRKLLSWRLKRRGTAVTGSIFDIKKVNKFSVNNRSPFIIKYEFTHPVSGEHIEGQSDYFWVDPAITGGSRIGDPITIFVNPQNPKEHWANI